ALRSHQRAVAAIDEGRFAEEVVPVTAHVVNGVRPHGREIRPQNGGLGSDAKVTTVTFAADEGPRRDTSMDALSKLRPAFHVAGSVTAGNSSQMSDGAAAILVTSGERARQRGLTPLGRFVAFATAGVEPERFGVGPVPAMRKALKLAGLTL